MAEWFIYSIIGITALGVLARIFRGAYLSGRTGWYHSVKSLFNRHLLFNTLEPVYKSILDTDYYYYQRLEEDQKKLFEQRVQKFIDMKEFIPRGGLREVSPEMKVKIAAAAIQITFGYPGIYFEHFSRILLYPDDYYSKINNTYHKGEVNSRGLIVLSWRSFEHGFEHPRDGINLALHEMAHALKLENTIMNREYAFINLNLLEEFREEARKEIPRILEADGNFFRRSAAANTHEFFAVAVENFFERPARLKEHNAKLYSLLCQLLRQDPLVLLRPAQA